MKNKNKQFYVLFSQRICDLRMIHLLFMLIMSQTLVGCASFSVKSKINGKTVEGIPYYFPKTYLLVTKNVAVVQRAIPPASKPAGKKKDRKEDGGEPISKPPDQIKISDPKYAFQVIYLPDLEKGPIYIKMSAGFGSVTANFPLINGWQFTGGTISIDSQTDENMTALGSFAGSMASLATTSSGTSDSGFVSSLEKVLAMLLDEKPEAPGIDETTVKDKLIKNLEDALKNLKPGIWLFEMKWDDYFHCVRFYLVDPFDPFLFNTDPRHGHHHPNWGRCQCGRHH